MTLVVLGVVNLDWGCLHYFVLECCHYAASPCAWQPRTALIEHCTPEMQSFSLRFKFLFILSAEVLLNKFMP